MTQASTSSTARGPTAAIRPAIDPALEAIVAAQKATGKIAFPVASLPENFGEARAAGDDGTGRLRAAGAGNGAGGDQGGADPGRVAPGWRPAPALPPRETRMLSEAEGKALLARAGVPVPGR